MWTSSTRKLLLSLFLFSCSFFQAEQGHSTISRQTISIGEDSSVVKVRTPDPGTQNKLLADPDFVYDKVGPAPRSLWTRFWEWFWRKAGELLDTEGGAIGFRIFEYLLILGAVALMIYLLFKNDIRALFYGKSASIPVDFSEFHEDIHRIDFNELIAEAVSKKDYRRAVRLHFLKLLKELSDKGLITWQINKTNRDYSVELANSKYSGRFAELSTLYEYIWYGEFNPDQEHYDNTLNKFKSFEI